MKQLGDLFLIVTGWQLRDLEAISAWQEKKTFWLSVNNTVIRDIPYISTKYFLLSSSKRKTKKLKQEIVFCCGLKCDSA